jgi:hypothetical protein
MDATTDYCCYIVVTFCCFIVVINLSDLPSLSTQKDLDIDTDERKIRKNIKPANTIRGETPWSKVQLRYVILYAEFFPPPPKMFGHCGSEKMCCGLSWSEEVKRCQKVNGAYHQNPFWRNKNM